MSAISSNFSGNALSQIGSRLDSYTKDVETLRNDANLICKIGLFSKTRGEIWQEMCEAYERLNNTATKRDLPELHRHQEFIKDELKHIVLYRATTTHKPKGQGIRTTTIHTIHGPETVYLVPLKDKNGNQASAWDLIEAKIKGSRETFTADFISTKKGPTPGEQKNIKFVNSQPNNEASYVSNDIGGFYVTEERFNAGAAMELCVGHFLTDKDAQDVQNDIKNVDKENSALLS